MGYFYSIAGVDATLGNGCKDWEDLHSFIEVKYLQGYSKNV